MTGKIVDLARAVTATAALAFAGFVSTVPNTFAVLLQQPAAAASASGESSVTGSEPVLEYAVRQGGALAVLVIVLFFYRRDYRYLTEFWKDQNKMLTELVAQNTKAQTDTAAALRENNVIVHQAKNVMAHVLPLRRAGERGPDVFDPT